MHKELKYVVESQRGRWITVLLLILIFPFFLKWNWNAGVAPYWGLKEINWVTAAYWLSTAACFGVFLTLPLTFSGTRIFKVSDGDRN